MVCGGECFQKRKQNRKNKKRKYKEITNLCDVWDRLNREQFTNPHTAKQDIQKNGAKNDIIMRHEAVMQYIQY